MSEVKNFDFFFKHLKAIMILYNLKILKGNRTSEFLMFF